MKTGLALALGAVLLAAGPARADFTIGAILSITGPAAALGGPERNALTLLPESVGGQKVRVVVLDDGTDTTQALKAARKLIDDEHVDVIFGPSTTPTSLAVLEAAAASGTPMVTVAGCAACVEPAEGAKRWAFKLSPNDAPIMDVITADMKRRGVSTMANFAFATSFGDAFAAAMDAAATRRGITPVLTVRYNPADATVTPQALRVIGAKPGAVFLAASGGPAVTPVIELRKRGYEGAIYANPGAAGTDVLRLGGAAAEGLFLAVSPFFVAEQLGEGNPVKPVALEFVRAYEAKFGAQTRSQPGASIWDAWVITQTAAVRAMAGAAPGTAGFRAALRDALERTDAVGSQGVFTMSAANHSGSDERALILAVARQGAWVLVK